MANSYKLGRRGKLYYNAGTYASPTWTEVNVARDVTTNLETETVDADCRALGDWSGQVAAGLKASIDFQAIWDPSNSVFAALRSAFFSLSPIEFLVLDGSITTSGSQGVRATCSILKFSRGEPLKGIMTADVSIAPTISDNAPSYYTV